MRFYKFLNSSTYSSSIQNYDKKIGDTGNTEEDSVEIVIKDDSNVDELVNTINKLSEKHGLDVERPRKSLETGDVIKITGPTEKIRQVEMELKEMGIR